MPIPSHDHSGWRQILRTRYSDIQRIIGTAETIDHLEAEIVVTTAHRNWSKTAKAEYLEVLRAISKTLRDQMARERSQSTNSVPSPDDPLSG